MNLSVELIQMALGRREALSRVPSPAEWEALYGFAEKQTLVGVLFSGVERLPEAQRPPRALLLQWYGNVQMIEQLNRKMNRLTAEVVERLQRGGFRCMVLKGQGLAQFYPQPLRRMCGDIDVWVTSHRRDDVVRYLRGTGEQGRVVYHNMPVRWLKETEVEVHFTPSWMNSYFANRRLQRFLDEHRNKVCEMDLCTGEHIPVPTAEMNAVFVLQHIYRHLFGSGIGLRQIMDYYFVLLAADEVLTENRERIRKTLRQLGMLKFAGAVMWVLAEVFRLPGERMIVGGNEKEGRWLLNEIVRAGNFGHYDDRIVIPREEAKWHSYLRITRQNLRLFSHYPEETVWNPAYRAWHYCWRKVKGFPL